MSVILWGAGTTGRVIARSLNAKGTPPLCLVDSDESKWGLIMEGTAVVSPRVAHKTFPGATWVCSVVRPERHEIIAQMVGMGVKTEPMWDYVPKRYNVPPAEAFNTVSTLLADRESENCWDDQLDFRHSPNTYKQIPPADIDHIYFEDFIAKRDDEHYVDCGAADGDTVVEFMARWENFSFITAFEPDEKNFDQLCIWMPPNKRMARKWAIADFDGETRFEALGDYSSHFDSNGKHAVQVRKLDNFEFFTPPTFIKMDIEGSELEALWGARKIIKEHSPVLAICAYHEASHLWEIPLLLHALNPEYSLFLRRYAESTFELVWYAVPKERVK